jgi:hypothetical protein
MKNYSVLILIFSMFSCTPKFQENEIKELIEKESYCFHTNSNRSKYLEYWGDSKEMKLSYSGVERSQTFLSISDLKSNTKKGIVPAATMAKSEYTNYGIRVSGSVAWAMFDQKAVTPEGRETYTHEFRFLEKNNGEWKIIGSSIHQYIPS